MAWHVFEKLLEGVANYSTFIGKIWITFLFIFRIIMVASVGDTVYNDEQSAFVCNTLQPGCTNVCFNQFSPISQIRFWAVQILFVGTPSIVFIVFAMHKMSVLAAKTEKEAENERRHGKERSVDFEDNKRGVKDRNRTNEKSVDDSSGKSSLPHYEDLSKQDYDKRAANGIVRMQKTKSNSSHLGSKENNYYGRGYDEVILCMEKPIDKSPKKEKKPESKVKRKTVYNKDGSSEVVKTPSIARAYFTQAIIRMAVEAVFLYLQFYMYKFEVKELYVCEGFPCPKQVDCFVSRPKEKTLFLQFMYVTTSFSLLLNFVEIIQLIKNFCARAFSNKGNDTFRQLYEQPRIYMAPSSMRRRRRRTRTRTAYPDLGPFPRTHGNSFTDTNDENSMDSDYRYYASQ